MQSKIEYYNYLLGDFYIADRSYKPKYKKKFEDYIKLTMTAEKAEDLFHLVEEYRDIVDHCFTLTVKIVFNDYIGWALPSKKACTKTIEAFNEHLKLFPKARLVDLGAGSGVFCSIFHELGIPKDNILAIEHSQSRHRLENQRKFWDVIVDDEFVADKEDVIFIAWGLGQDCVLEKYIEDGGKCVIILGESNTGCTLPSNWFYVNDYEGWTTKTKGVPAACSFYPATEFLTVNTRY